MMSDSVSDCPMDVEAAAEAALAGLLPEKSKKLYEAEYKKFETWRMKNKIPSLDEKCLLAYFSQELANQKPSSKWTHYSMLKATINMKMGIDISSFKNLVAFLKRKSDGFRPKKSKILTQEEIFKFLKDADDNVHLLTKAAEYSSYQNTIGRRSTLMGGGAPYTHMSKYSYPTDMSLSSHYGYTSWGLWRDTRNLSSSMYGQKQKNYRSVSILLISAAFIVVLAVLCVAALAFYFSAFKTDLSDSILVFDCTFRVTRGDIYTTGLRSNNTPVFRQKSAFYERLIDTSLEQSGLTVSRTEVMDFGDGPTIVLSFRVFLDMRKIKITINNVEEHIRQAVLSELANPKSAFKNIRVDPDTIEIKRLLDQEVLKTAFLTKEEPFPPVFKAPEDRYGPPAKKSGVIEKTIHKFTPKISTSTVPSTSAGDKRPQPRQPQPQQHQPADGESDIDMDNLPVIQGSFEITKTDADITQKRGTAAGNGAGVTATLKPFAVSPAQIRVRNGGSEKRRNENVKTSYVEVENVPLASSTMQPTAVGKPKYETATAKIEKTDKHGATTKKIKTNSSSRSSSTSRRTTSTTTTTTTTVIPSTTTTTTTAEATTLTTTSTTPKTTIKSTTSRSTTPTSSESDLESYLSINDRNDTLLEDFLQAIINDSLPEELAAQNRMDENIPKLDVSLFTSAPILDKQPWQPIRPTVPKGIPLLKFDPSKAPKKKPTLAEEILYRNKHSDIESSLYTESPSGQLYYQSFTNPSFGSSTLGIEPLGGMDVKPYPLPVDKISIDPVPDFKQMTPTAVSISEKLMNMTLDELKFEHLGGGVIAKKPENKTTPYRTTTESMKTRVITVTPVYVERISENLVNSTEEYVEYYQVDGANFTESDTTTMMMDEFNDTLDYSLGVESRISPDEEVYSTEAVTVSTVESGSVEKFTEMSFEFGTSESLVTTTELPEVDTMTASTTEMLMTTTETTTEQPKTTTSSKRSTFVEVETLKYNPTTSVPTATVTVPELFPINKWEFVNGSRVTGSNRQSTRKVFNETLQALIVENVQLPTTMASVKIEDLQSKRNNSTNLQNLSAIFDTLASKLGIQTEVSSKSPPFSSLSKIKNQYKNSATRLEGGSTRNRTRSPTRPKRKKNKNTNRTTKIRTTTSTTTTTTAEAPTTISTTPRTTTTTPPPLITTPRAKLVPTVINEDIVDIVPVMLGAAGPEFSSEYYAGQAEVEIIDPNQYEEMLRLLATTPSGAVRFATTTPVPSALVTLLPAKSNSGIKNFRPKIKLHQGASLLTRSSSVSSSLAAHNQQSSEEGRKMSESLKLMNANNGYGGGGAGGDDNVDNGRSTVVSRAGDAEAAAPLMAESGGWEFENQNDNKNNMEAVVRASMHFES